MDLEHQQHLFEDKYQEKLGMSFNQWLETAPDTEDEAYARCEAIDKELKGTYEQWFEAEGEAKEKLEDYRDKLKLEYDLIEEMFGLELDD